MFKYTNFPDEHPQSGNSPKNKSRSSSIQMQRQSSARPTSECRSGKPSTPQKDKDISERYTNRSYNRLPSPKGRVQPVTNSLKERPPFVVGKPSTIDEEWSKPSISYWNKPPKPLPRSLPAKQSCTEVLAKKRPLDMECRKSHAQIEVEMKARPRTSHMSRTEARMENKVFNTVQNVLSRALLQQGKIDETNIEFVMNSMRHSLYLEKHIDDEELTEIDVESKQSRTTVNSNFEEQPVVKKNRAKAGIVRKDTPMPHPERKPYRKIYHHAESAPTHKNVSEVDDKTFVSVDVPDLVLPNTPSSKNTESKLGKRQSEINNCNPKNSKRENESHMKQFEVGDSQTKTQNSFWNSEEDAKLREYVESLLHNMKGHVTFDTSITNTGEHHDSQGNLCRSLCVCKVCCSKSNTSKEVPTAVAETPKPPESPKPPHRGAGSRLRLQKPSSPKAPEANSQCKFIKKTNSNFQPESSLNTSLNKKTSYTVVDENGPEEGDDMYLQQRIRKTTSRRGSVKINF